MSSAPAEHRDTAPARPADGTPLARPGRAAQVPGRVWPSALARFAPIIVPVAAMAVAGVWGLARDSAMGNDEVATRWAALLSLRQLAHLLRHVDAVHGLYYLLMHAWVVVGSSPAVLRIPSVISMAVAAGLIAVIGRRLTGSGWAGLFAGLIMVLTPSITYYAQTARSYALVFACVVGATLALLRALSAEAAGAGGLATRRWLLYAVLVAVGGYLNEMSLLMLAAHGVTVLMARYGRTVIGRWAVSGAASAALVLPLLALSVGQNAAVSWITRPGLGSLRTLFHDYFGATAAAGVLLLGCAVIAVLPPRGGWRRPAGPGPRADASPTPAASADQGPTASAAPGDSASAAPGGSASAAPGVSTSAAPGVSTSAAPGGSTKAEPESAWWRRGGVSLPSVAAPLLVLPALLLLLESAVGSPLYVDRYVLFGEAGAALLAGAGVYRIGQWLGAAAARPRALIWVPGAVVCACALVLQLGPQQQIRTPESRQYDFGGPSRYLAARAQPGDGVLYFGTLFRKAELGYPADFRDVRDFGMALSPKQAGTFRGTDKPFAVTGPLMLKYQRIWVIGARPSEHLPAGLLQQESTVLTTHFSLVASRQFRGITVTLWLRR